MNENESKIAEVLVIGLVGLFSSLLTKQILLTLRAR